MNSITLRNNGGVAASNYPLQFARPFAQGEIAAYPQMGVCADASCGSVTSWLTTQADVKVRWEDGSVKHAIVSVVIPSIAPGSTTYTFRDQASCNCGEGETKAQMLAGGYNFDATMRFTQNSAAKTASARGMISDWAQTTLASGASASGTTIQVTSAAGFPPAPFPITVGGEEMQVTSKNSGTSWSVTRGWNGTTATSHAGGAGVMDQRVRYWVAGSVATTVKIGDFSQNRLYELGWQQKCVMTLAGAVPTSATSIPVSDASCAVGPSYGRLYRPASGTAAVNGLNAEDVYVCGVNTSVTPHQLLLGAVGCASVPSSTGRARRGTQVRSYVAGDAIHLDNAWQEPASDTYKSIKPVFYATFWPSLNKVYVRFVSEITDSERLQDQVYDITMTAGAASPVTIFSGPQVQRYATRFSKLGWVGAAPPVIDILHNVEYVASTKLFWNWDPSRVPTDSFIDTEYATYVASAHTNCGDSGKLQRAEASPGGRYEIGVENLWFVDWFYTGSAKMREMAFDQTDLSACGFPWHIREGDPAKRFDRARTINGFGKPLSPSDRRTTAFSTGLQWVNTAAADRVVPVGSVSNANWWMDREHLINMPVVYILSGDDFYREEMEFLATYSCHMKNGAAVPPNTSGRGPTGAECWEIGNARNHAWGDRYYAELATYEPDGTPEKTLFRQFLADELGPLQATLGIPNSYPSDPVYTAMYNYGANYTVNQKTSPLYRINGQPHPMGLLQATQGAEFVEKGYGVDPAYVGTASSLYETGYWVSSLGLIRDMGLYKEATQSILSRVAPLYVGAATNPDFNPYLLGGGRIPSTKKSDGKMISSWAEMKAGYFATLQQAQAAGATVWQGLSTWPGSKFNPQGAYELISAAAIAQIADQPGGREAWEVMKPLLASFTALNDVPVWNLLPRSTSPAGITLTASPAAVAFSCVEGGAAPAPRTIAIGASGGVLDQFTASESEPWLSVSPASGAGAGNVMVTATCPAAGNYSGTITIASTTSGVVNSPVPVVVTLVVLPSPKTRLGGAGQVSGRAVIR